MWCVFGGVEIGGVGIDGMDDGCVGGVGELWC